MPEDLGTDRKVVKMTHFANTARFQPLREVEGYWEAIRGGRLVPRRSDLNPRGIERALEFAFIAERIAPGLGRVRIAGSHLTDLMGMEVRGMPVTTFFTAAARAQVGEALEEVCTGPAKAELLLTAETGFGKPPLEARLLLLPLKSDLGDISRILGCLVTVGDIGRAPRRFDVAEVTMRPLLKDGAVRDEGPIAPVRHRPEPVGLSEAPARFEPGPAPYLRLVKTDHSD